MIYSILGIISIISAIIIGYNISEVKLGIHSSRLIALICALVGYYSISNNVAEVFTFLHNDISNFGIRLIFMVLFGGVAILLIWNIYINRKEEFKHLLQSGGLLLIIVLLIIVRFCFASAI